MPIEGGLFQLSQTGRETGEVDVYIECSDVVKKIEVPDDQYDAEDESEEQSDESDESEKEQEPGEEKEEEEYDDEDIPEDDMDVDESDNEIAEEGEKNAVEEVDDGEDVVVEVGDAENDIRFTSLIKEAESDEASKNEEFKDTRTEVREEGAESDIDDHIGDVSYPDTPVDTEEEWEILKEKPQKQKGNIRFHGDYEKEPYLWLFHLFNSGDEFKSQLLRYALKTQFDVKWQSP